MTERMENALNHIKTSVDVDPWAIEVVEKVFRGVDDAVEEIENYVCNIESNTDKAQGMVNALRIFVKHTKVGDAE